MSKIHPISKFLLILVVSLSFVFLIHTWLLKRNGHSGDGDMILLSYTINFLLAAVIYIALFVFRQQLKNHIGFLFMFGSFLKFIIFFLVFYPPYKADGEMSRLEFAAFFVPYAICLAVETFFTARMLQKLK